MIKAVFSASFLQSSVSRDPSEITLVWWSDAQVTFLIIISVENSRAASYFCGNPNIFYFSRLFDEWKFKRTAFILLHWSLLSLLANLMHHWLAC